MFGTMGFSELIIILVIVLIIFGAGRLPQIGEGLGKALKGFKKEVHEVPPPPDETAKLTRKVGMSRWLISGVGLSLLTTHAGGRSTRCVAR